MEITLLNGHCIDPCNIAYVFITNHTMSSLRTDCTIFKTFNRDIRKHLTWQLASHSMYEIRYLFRNKNTYEYNSIFFDSRNKRDNYFKKLKTDYGLHCRDYTP